jgi:hypothetical protein
MGLWLSWAGAERAACEHLHKRHCRGIVRARLSLKPLLRQRMHHATLHHRAPLLVLLFACLPSAARADETAKSRVAIIGTADIALYGQQGYCGSMTSYDKSNTEGVLIEGARRTWFRLKHQRDCVGDFSFVPEPGRAYILRAGTPSRHCLAGLYRVNPGAQPTAEPMLAEDRRSCLLPWNHGTGAASEVQSSQNKD